MSSLENLRALADGRVSGRISEWPALPLEAQKALVRLAEAEALLKEAKELVRWAASPYAGRTAERIDAFLEKPK